MTIIGLTGYARSGKDTVGQMLVEDYGFTRIAFGDVLKQVAEDTNPILEICKEDPDGGPYSTSIRALLDAYRLDGGWERVKDNYPEARQYLVDLGNSLRKRLPGIEGEYTRAKAAEHGDVVNTNVYHPEEIKAIQAMGGFVFRVVRPGYGPANADEANTSRCPVDATVCNDGGVPKLQVNLDRSLRYLGLVRA